MAITTVYETADFPEPLPNATGSPTEVHEIDPDRLRRAKWAFTTRRVSRLPRTVLVGDRTPATGDLLLARVTRIGQHRRIEDAAGRRRHMFVGDEIVVAYGNRYAPDQFEARVPASSLEKTNLVAAGGIAATMMSRHESMKPATQITPIGLLGDEHGEVMNLDQFAIDTTGSDAATRPTVIGVIGASMNSGKTSMGAALIRGLVSAGVDVAAVKVTGTGSGGDLWLYHDSGAAVTLDFTDAGLASTFGVDPVELVARSRDLIQEAASSASVVVVEVADGLFQLETAALMADPEFLALFDGFMFAAPDPLAALAGRDALSRLGVEPLVVGGMVTRSPLSMTEAELALGRDFHHLKSLEDPAVAMDILSAANGTVVEV